MNNNTLLLDFSLTMTSLPTSTRNEEKMGYTPVLDEEHLDDFDIPVRVAQI
jgi:hypothetical protein